MVIPFDGRSPSQNPFLMGASGPQTSTIEDVAKSPTECQKRVDKTVCQVYNLLVAFCAESCLVYVAPSDDRK